MKTLIGCTHWITPGIWTEKISGPTPSLPSYLAIQKRFRRSRRHYVSAIWTSIQVQLVLPRISLDVDVSGFKCVSSKTTTTTTTWCDLHGMEGNTWGLGVDVWSTHGIYLYLSPFHYSSALLSCWLYAWSAEEL